MNREGARCEYEKQGFSDEKMRALWEACGRSVREMAKALDVTTRTIKTYRKKLALPLATSHSRSIGASKYIVKWHVLYGDAPIPPSAGEFARKLGEPVSRVVGAMHKRRKAVEARLRQLPGIEGLAYLFTTRENWEVPGAAIARTEVRLVGHRERVFVKAYLKSGVECTMLFKLADYLDIIASRA